jgi:hypothetical protein
MVSKGKTREIIVGDPESADISDVSDQEAGGQDWRGNPIRKKDKNALKIHLEHR